MSTDVEQIRADLEATRANLVTTIDELAERTDPAQAAQRAFTRVRDGVWSRLADVASVPARVLPERVVAALPAAIPAAVAAAVARLPELVWSVPGRLLDLPARVSRVPRAGIGAARCRLHRLWGTARRRLVVVRRPD